MLSQHFGIKFQANFKSFLKNREVNIPEDDIYNMLLAKTCVSIADEAKVFAELSNTPQPTNFEESLKVIAEAMSDEQDCIDTVDELAEIEYACFENWNLFAKYAKLNSTQAQAVVDWLYDETIQFGE